MINFYVILVSNFLFFEKTLCEQIKLIPVSNDQFDWRKIMRSSKDAKWEEW